MARSLVGSINRRLEIKTLSAIAADTGLDLSSISKIMAGRRTPNLRSAGLIARSLGVTVDELYAHLCEGREWVA